MHYVLDEAQTLIAAIATIFLGRAVNGWGAFLRQANIPPAITGGFLVCILLALLWWTMGWQVSLGGEAKAVLLLAFFSAIGFGLGATPVAMGTLKRLEHRFGPAPLALLMVTLAVSFFIDYANAVVIQGFLLLLK